MKKIVIESVKESFSLMKWISIIGSGIVALVLITIGIGYLIINAYKYNIILGILCGFALIYLFILVLTILFNLEEYKREDKKHDN